MSGHSFGGYTTLVLAGSKLSPALAAPVPTGFAGFIGMSGQGPAAWRSMTRASRDRAAATWPPPARGTLGAAGETPAWRG